MKHPKIVLALDRILYLIGKQGIYFWVTKKIAANSDSFEKPRKFLRDCLASYAFLSFTVRAHSFTIIGGGSRAAATSQMERFAIMVNGFQPLTIITKRSIWDVAAALDPPLIIKRLLLYESNKTKWIYWHCCKISHSNFWRKLKKKKT